MSLPLSPHEIRVISTQIPCDPRGIRKVLRGEKVEELHRKRIEQKLKELGYGHMIPEADERST